MTELAALCFLKAGGVGGPGRGLTPFRAEPRQPRLQQPAGGRKLRFHPSPARSPILWLQAALEAQRPGPDSTPGRSRQCADPPVPVGTKHVEGPAFVLVPEEGARAQPLGTATKPCCASVSPH